MLKLYNTLTRKIEEISKKDHLNLYTCGPTVYNYAHIGNLRSYIMADLLYRTLKYEGYNPKWVMNITDIDDKTIKGTIEKFGKEATVENLREFTKFYLDEFFKDLEKVNVLKDEIIFIRVTDKIKDIQEFIVELINKGYAYKAEDGSTYFSIKKYQDEFSDYGELVGHKFLEGKKVGARVKVDEYEKDNLSDFALWKAWDENDAEIYWEHPVLGKGRPGWHIECSVINKIAFNGEPTDIHTGGVDLIFPHHTNEIAQSQALLGKGNFVKHWMHIEHLQVNGKKMAKRDGNVYTVEDILKKNFTGIDLRLQFFGAHYKAKQNFTWDSLNSNRTGLERSYANPESADTNEILKYLNNNLAVTEAIGYIQSQAVSLRSFGQIFGLAKRETSEDLPGKVKDLVNSRITAKELRNFAESDELRLQIEALGYEVMDTPEGQKVKKKIQI